jgi:molybdate transport system substrate-binding protein
MRSRTFRIWLALLLLASFEGRHQAGAGASEAAKQELTVSAAVSLKDVLDEIAQLYRVQKPSVVLRFNLGGSGTLQRQIEQGAPVDVFISASPTEMDSLESKSLLVPGTRKDLARNRIVLIVPNDKTGIAGFQDLAKPEVKLIALGEPQTVPAGKYAQEVLTHLGLYDRLKPKYVLGRDVRQVLTYVATGNTDAGIVYATDAQTSKKVKVVATAPEDSHSPVIYPVAIIKGAKNSGGARDFENFLLGSQARAVFQKYGFTPANSDLKTRRDYEPQRYSNIGAQS